MTDEKLEKVDKLQPLAAELGCTLPQLAVAWAASNPDVSSVILGATKVCGWRRWTPFTYLLSRAAAEPRITQMARC